MMDAKEGPWEGLQIMEIFRQRQSTRAYSSAPVEEEKIMRCLEAARIAPSACNAQPWKFIIVDDEELKNKLADLTSNKVLPLNHFTRQAPVFIVLVMEAPNFTSGMGELIRDKKFTLMDVGIAAEHFCLQATAEGLGTCMLGWFKEKQVKNLLQIPQKKRAMLIITLGYPKTGMIREKNRKPLTKIFTKNGY